VDEERSDYKGHVGLEAQPLEIVGHRRSLYAGLRLQTRARAGPNFKITKVKGHDQIRDDTTPEEAYNVLGNMAVDAIARESIRHLPKPTETEVAEWHRQVEFLKRYLRYVPRALSLWPTLQPSSGHRSLPRRRDHSPQEAVSFRADVLGPWWVPSGRRPDDEAAERTTTQVSQPVSQVGLEGAAPSSLDPPRAEPQPDHESHDWGRKGDGWMCRACLAQSRAAQPPPSRCPGFASRIRAAAADPKGHNLLYSTFSSGEPGIVVICSKCGHYATSNRPCFQERCKGPQSSGAESHYDRVSKGMHPKHAQGDAKVLHPLQRLCHLLAIGEDRFAQGAP
jgi:hypothetical protein